MTVDAQVSGCQGESNPVPGQDGGGDCDVEIAFGDIEGTNSYSRLEVKANALADSSVKIHRPGASWLDQEVTEWSPNHRPDYRAMQFSVDVRNAFGRSDIDSVRLLMSTPTGATTVFDKEFTNNELRLDNNGLVGNFTFTYDSGIDAGQYPISLEIRDVQGHQVLFQHPDGVTMVEHDIFLTLPTNQPDVVRIAPGQTSSVEFMVEHTGSAGKAMDVRFEVTSYIPNSWSDPLWDTPSVYSLSGGGAIARPILSIDVPDADLSDAPDRLEIEAHAFAENSEGQTVQVAVETIVLDIEEVGVYSPPRVSVYEDVEQQIQIADSDRPEIYDSNLSHYIDSSEEGDFYMDILNSGFDTDTFRIRVIQIPDGWQYRLFDNATGSELAEEGIHSVTPSIGSQQILGVKLILYPPADRDSQDIGMVSMSVSSSGDSELKSNIDFTIHRTFGVLAEVISDSDAQQLGRVENLDPRDTVNFGIRITDSGDSASQTTWKIISPENLPENTQNGSIYGSWTYELTDETGESVTVLRLNSGEFGDISLSIELGNQVTAGIHVIYLRVTEEGVDEDDNPRYFDLPLTLEVEEEVREQNLEITQVSPEPKFGNGVTETIEYRIDNQNNIPLNVFITTVEPNGWTSELKASAEQNGGSFLLLTIDAYGTENFNVDITPPESTKNGEEITFRIEVTPMDESAPYGPEYIQYGDFNYLTSCSGLACLINEITNPSQTTIALMVLGAILVLYWVNSAAKNRANRAAGLVVKEFEESVESLEEEQADSEIPEPVKMEEEEDDDLELLEELKTSKSSLEVLYFLSVYEQRTISLMSHKCEAHLVIAMRMLSPSTSAQQKLAISGAKQKISSLSLVTIMLLSLFATIQIGINQVSAASDQDGDGLTYGLEYLMNTAPNDPDSDNDGLPDGWEWMHGLDPLSANNADGAVGDPDGDGMSNLQEYTYLMPSGWDSSNTPSVLDNGVWWNGTVPTNDWNEEGALVYNQPACSSTGSDGTGNTILCDEDPVGNICTNGFDDDKDGLVDSADPDNDGDADCSSDDDDGDGIADEDVAGWDTDGDGMPDGWEVSYGLNATSASNDDGANGDPDGDGLNNLYEYVNPSWTTLCNGVPCWNPGPNGQVTETISPCDPVTGIGPGGCATLTAEVDGITSTNPTRADTDGDGLNDSYEALTLLTDPTSSDTDSDGISDGVEVGSAYGQPAQSSNPRDNNTDGDAFDDGDEDKNGNGILDAGETDPTRREDAGDFDNDGIQNWEENLSCTAWDIADTDFGGVNDGDERNVSHGTDPCDSLTDFKTTISNWNSLTSQLTLTDGSGFNPSGGVGWYNSSGTWSAFSYIAVVNNVLQQVSPGPANGVTEVANRNGSFCHTSATNDGTISTTRNYCDDDYTDGDGDGLADWEELLGTYGWFSNPTLVDTDADGVPDFQEAVLDNTDPNDPCLNLLDSDGDGLNNYFENSTGCTLDSLGITNGSSDIWVTGWDQIDTDNGGVGDRDEYFDGTNPENDPSDDLLPDDFDGDGIPDAVENASSTDWRNPDTDGGGMMDGAECPEQFWFFNCVGAPFNPLDPTDDQVNNDIIFWANNTTGTVDIEQPHYWRLTTSDFYTGSTYAHLNSVHPPAEVITPITNLTNLADLSFANDTVTWNIVYNFPISTGNIPQPYYLSNISYWTDAGAVVLRANDTHTLSLETGSLEILLTQQPEYYFDWATLASTTIGHTNSTYATILPAEFTNQSFAESMVMNISNGVVTDAGALDAYSKASALADFLVNGNATTEFKRNYNSSNLPGDADLTMHMLNVAKEGTCAEFATTFVTMARSLGLPARLVTGYQDGIWTGTGYAVYANARTTWGEVRLQQNSANGNTDLGWIPFESCPEPENLTIANQTINTLTWDRDGSQEVSVSGQLLYADNSTPIPDIPLVGYLVRTDDVDGVPGDAAIPGREFGSIITDANGNFTINGTPSNPVLPGFTQIVINHKQSGYVGDDGIAFDQIINVTDDSEIVHVAPNAVNSPVVGAGATTIVSGILQLESNPQLLDDYYQGLSVWLSFTSSVDGAQNLTGIVEQDGSWQIEVSLDPLETKTNLSAQLGFSGWTDTGQVFASPVHIRDSTQPINLDIRDAPNLTATIEGPGANNSVIDLDDTVYINGTAVSFGATPQNMEGMLSFRMRENDSGGDFIEIFNQSVNGTFSIPYFLNSTLIPVAAGEIEMILRFYPTLYEATDDANLSTGAPYALRGVLTYEVDAQSQLRGGPANLLIQLYDHRGASVGLNVPGNYDFIFNNSWVNTTVDPASTLINLAFDIDANMFAGDYPFDISFNGSDLYVPNSDSTTVRVMAEIGWNLTSADDWVHIGNSTFITGDFYDAVHNTRVVGNDTLLTLVLLTEEGPIDLALGQLDNTTGEFNLTAKMPTTLPSGVYTLELAADFLSLAPPGGAYYTWVDTATPPSPPSSISIEIGIESEVVIVPEQEQMLILSGDTMDLAC